AKSDMQMRVFCQYLIAMHDNEPAGHAQVNGEDQIVLEVNPDLFAVAADFLDAHARKTLFDGDGRAVKHVAAMEMDGVNDATGQMLGQATCDGFNFGEFGHKSLASALARAKPGRALILKTYSWGLCFGCTIGGVGRILRRS